MFDFKTRQFQNWKSVVAMGVPFYLIKEEKEVRTDFYLMAKYSLTEINADKLLKKYGFKNATIINEFNQTTPHEVVVSWIVEEYSEFFV